MAADGSHLTDCPPAAAVRVAAGAGTATRGSAAPETICPADSPFGVYLTNGVSGVVG
jgi:hypothetical protein